MKVFFVLEGVIPHVKNPLINRGDFCLIIGSPKNPHQFRVLVCLQKMDHPIEINAPTAVFFENPDSAQEMIAKGEPIPAELVGSYVTFFKDIYAYFILSEGLTERQLFKTLVAIHDYGYQQLFNPNKNYFKKILDRPEVRGHVQERKTRFLHTRELKKFFAEIKGRKRRLNVRELSFDLKNAGCNDVSLRIDFNPESLVQSSSFAFIGKNGVGKSRALQAIHKVALEQLIFSRVIAINLFRRRNMISNPSLMILNTDSESKTSITALLQNLLELNESKYFFDRLQLFLKTTKEILNGGTIALATTDATESVPIREIRDPRQIILASAPDYLNAEGEIVHLSSGQSYLLRVVLNLILGLEDESIVLFDEPETYLHPNFIVMSLPGFSDHSKFLSHRVG